MENDPMGKGKAVGAEPDGEFCLLFRCNPIPMWIFSTKTLQFLEVNNAAVSSYGYTKEEFLRMTIADIRPKEDEAALRAFLDQVPPVYSNRGIWRHKFKDGSIHSMEIQAHPIVWRGETAQFITAIDVTDRLEAKSQLEAREERYRKAHENSPFPVMIFADSGEVLSISRAWTQITGYELDDISTYGEWAQKALKPGLEGGSDLPSYDFDLTRPERNSCLVITCKDGSTRIWDAATIGLGQQADGRQAAITMAFDVTEMAQASLDLRQSEARFRRAIDEAPYPIMIDAEDGTVIAVNKAWTEISGYTHEEIPTIYDWLEKAYGEQASKVSQLVKPRFELTATKDFGDFSIRTKDGQTRIWRFAGTNLGQIGGRGRAIISAAHDVTEQRALETALRESEERLLRAIEEAPYPVMIHAVGAQVIALSRSWLEGTGYSYEDLMDIHSWTDQAFGDQAEHIRKGIEEVQSRSSQKHSGEYKVKTKHGEEIDWEIVTVAAGRTVDGRNMAISIAYDATQRNKASEVHKLQTAALSAAANGIVITDRDGIIEWVNPAFVKLTGFTAEEAEGLNPKCLVRSGLHPASFYEEMWQTILAGNVWKGELTNKRKDGSIYYEEMTITPVPNLSGEITHFVGIKQDISSRRLAEQRLKQWNEELEESIRLRTAELATATEEAERANQAKSEFLSRMSHELRTPLNSILGFAQILKLHDFGEEVRNISEPILKAGHHLLDLIDEVLDISRIEVGKLTISREAVSSKQIVNDAIDLVMPLAHKSGVEIIERLDFQAAHFTGDRRRAVQVLVNLLSNAIKYNVRNGSVTLTSKKEGHFIVFEVADTGTGISGNDQERLFIPFERFGDRFVDGTGLGLSLSQKLARIMGGDLYLVNSSPEGSVFALRLPLSDRAPVERIANPRAESSDLLLHFGGSVLYIEDNLENIHLIEQLFKYYPEVKLYPAMQGKTGLDFARLHRPDLILLDSHLPDIDGFDVLEILKAESATKAIPVVVLTANASSEHKKEMLLAGASDFLTKPVQLDQLMGTIERLLVKRLV